MPRRPSRNSRSNSSRNKRRGSRSRPRSSGIRMSPRHSSRRRVFRAAAKECKSIKFFEGNYGWDKKTIRNKCVLMNEKGKHILTQVYDEQNLRTSLVNSAVQEIFQKEENDLYMTKRDDMKHLITAANFYAIDDPRGIQLFDNIYKLDGVTLSRELISIFELTPIPTRSPER